MPAAARHTTSTSPAATAHTTATRPAGLRAVLSVETVLSEVFPVVLFGWGAGPPMAIVVPPLKETVSIFPPWPQSASL